MKRASKIVLIIVGGLAVLGIVGNIIGSNNTSNTVTNSPTTTESTPSSAPTSTPTPAPQSQDKDSELQAMLQASPAPTFVKSDVDEELTYTLTNNTNDTFDYVELDVDFFNKEGVKIDDGMTNTTHVTPGQKFQLQVTTMDTNVASYKVVGIYSDSLHD